MSLNWLTDRPIAHRGLHNVDRGVCENSLSAFANAIDHQFSIECDLQYAADGVPVVFHDFDLQRICGLKGHVRDKMSNELGLMAIGQTEDNIPTLAQMLNLVKGRAPLILELKGRLGDDDGFAGAVLDALEDYSGQVALMSFDHHLLRDLRALKCHYPLGLTAQGDEPETFFTHEEALSLGIDFISYAIDHLPNPFIEGQRNKNMPIISWTVRTKEQKIYSEQYADQITFEGFDPVA